MPCLFVSALAVVLLLLSCVDVGSRPTIHSFRALPERVELGNEATLSWVASNYTAVTLEPEHRDVTLLSQCTVSPQAVTEYTLIATNRHGAARATVRVLVYAQGASNDTSREGTTASEPASSPQPHGH